MENEVQPIIRSVDIAVSPGAVWAALIDHATLGTWMGGDVTIDPKPGGAISLRTSTETKHGAIDQMVPAERLSFIWYDDERDPSEVIFDLLPNPHGTTVRVTERKFTWEFQAATRPTAFDGAPLSRILAGVR